jgi:hypothetical protein
MRDPLNKDEMEQYLENQVNQHRIYPSDHIWRNIQEQLHEPVRWPALPFILLFIIAALVVGTLLVKPEEHFVYRSRLLSTALPLPQPAKKANTPSLEESMATGAITEKTIAYATERLRLYKPDDSVVQVKDSASNITQPLLALSASRNSGMLTVLAPVAASLRTQPDPVTITGNEYIDSLANAAITPEEPAIDTLAGATNLQQESHNAPVIKIPAPESRWSFQLYLTPSATYRRLVSGKGAQTPSVTPGNAPLAPGYTDDVNHVVQHSPARGWELGFSIGYQLNKQFTVKAGLQYNRRQYNIAASSAHSYEQVNVALNGHDTLRAFSPYRNLKGYYPVTLRNTYQELSIPLSISWKGWQHNKLSWHVSASFQPTLALSKNVFLISTDFKNYVDGSSLMRTWNINTSFETWLSYRTGNVEWQLGPQFRYQQLSTFKKEYPIREFLLDYGIKLGFTTTIK